MKQVAPRFLAHVHAAHKAVGPVIAEKFAILILEQQGLKESFRMERLGHGVPVMHDQAKKEFGSFRSREELFVVGSVAENFRQELSGRHKYGAAMQSGKETIKFLKVHGAVFPKLVEEFLQNLGVGVLEAVQDIRFLLQ